MSDIPNPNPEDNSAIRAARQQIANLEQQLSQVKVDANMTATEKATLEAQKTTLENEKATLLQQVAEKEALQQRATELESRFATLVSEELAKFPEDKKASVQTMIDGLSPDKQLDKLKALKDLIGVVVTPPPGNPPPPPRNPNNPHDPPAPDEDKLKDYKELVKRGQDPLAGFPLAKPDLSKIHDK